MFYDAVSFLNTLLLKIYKLVVLTERRNLNNMTESNLPFEDKMHKLIFSKGIAKRKLDGTLFPGHRKYLVNLTDLEVVSTYNAELRGICNYYNMAVDFRKFKLFGVPYAVKKTRVKAQIQNFQCHQNV